MEVRNRLIDIGIGREPPVRPDGELSFERLFDDPLYVVAGPTIRWPGDAASHWPIWRTSAGCCRCRRRLSADSYALLSSVRGSDAGVHCHQHVRAGSP